MRNCFFDLQRVRCIVVLKLYVYVVPWYGTTVCVCFFCFSVCPSTITHWRVSLSQEPSFPPRRFYSLGIGLSTG